MLKPTWEVEPWNKARCSPEFLVLVSLVNQPVFSVCAASGRRKCVEIQSGDSCQVFGTLTEICQGQRNDVFLDLPTGGRLLVTVLLPASSFLLKNNNYGTHK